MTQDQIEKAATDYVKPLVPQELTSLINGLKETFISGANWRIESVWHDGSETPKIGCPILGITIFGEPIIDGPFGIEYDVNIDMSNIKKWAYIKDLLPEDE